MISLASQSSYGAARVCNPFLFPRFVPHHKKLFCFSAEARIMRQIPRFRSRRALTLAAAQTQVHCLYASFGLVLSGAYPKYIMPEYNSEWDISGGMTAFQVEQALKDLEAENKRASAVLVTSPTYDGICSNITEVRDLCHSYRIPVIVDEAHGGHFGFHDHLPETALEQRADLAVQSTYKSSSPNNLLLASLDATRALLSGNPISIFTPAIDFAIKAKKDLKKISGISVLNLSSFSSSFPAIYPFRITVGVSQLGISGYQADDVLCEE